MTVVDRINNKTRFDWVDQARGLSIFLVVYGHNFPVTEPYIYSFHVPLFFFIAGMFHPKAVNAKVIKRRAKMILIPYFVWATALYLFWLFLGRNYGDSLVSKTSPLDNFVGIFYAQGGSAYMEWGIPLWFLPCIFLVFMIFSAVQRLQKQQLVLIGIAFCCALGFLWAEFADIHLAWSLDVALVATGFYGLGNVLKNNLLSLSRSRAVIILTVMLAINITAYYFNYQKVDMYRSVYGSQLLFFISGLAGSVAYLMFFRVLPVFRFLSYLGRHTIVLLATHVRMLTVIKLFAVLVLGITVFEFSEVEKLILSVIQVIMVIPFIWLVNKYIPILDGKIKKD